MTVILIKYVVHLGAPNSLTCSLKTCFAVFHDNNYHANSMICGFGYNMVLLLFVTKFHHALNLPTKESLCFHLFHYNLFVSFHRLLDCGMSSGEHVCL